MKIQLDFDNKIIKVEDNVKFSELIKTLNKLFIKKEWMDFTLETSTVIYSWPNTTILREIPFRPLESPWYSTSYLSGTSLNDTVLSGGVYNVDV